MGHRVWGAGRSGAGRSGRRPIVTLTTDFGWAYVGQMKGVILSICPDANLVDIAHDIPSQDIQTGQFTLYTAVPYFPNAIHVAVVDPGVGTSRRGLVIETKRGVLVGPDNGLLIPAARRMGMQRVFEIKNRKLWLSNVSNTFHGRDVFAPVAAHIANGTKLDSVGPEIQSFIDSSFPVPVVTDDAVHGSVVYVDRFGNLITNIPQELTRRRFDYGDEVEIEVDGEVSRVKFLPYYASARSGSLLCTISSSGLFEIAANSENASSLLGLSVRDGVVVRKASRKRDI